MPWVGGWMGTVVFDTPIDAAFAMTTNVASAFDTLVDDRERDIGAEAVAAENDGLRRPERFHDGGQVVDRALPPSVGSGGRSRPAEVEADDPHSSVESSSDHRGHDPVVP